MMERIANAAQQLHNSRAQTSRKMLSQESERIEWEFVRANRKKKGQQSAWKDGEQMKR